MVLAPLIVLGLVLALGASGCSTALPEGDSSRTSSPPELTGLTASLYQTRMDVAAGQVEVRLTNGSTTEISLRRMSLDSSGYDAPMDYPRSGSVLASGRVVDLPVALAPVRCGAGQSSPGELRHDVHLDYALADGSLGSVVLPARDEGGRIADLHAAACFAQQAEAVASLQLTTPPTLGEIAGTPVIELTLEVTPQGGPGTLVLGRVRDTTLLALVDPRSGQRLPDGHDLRVTATGTDPRREVPLSLTPGRCDAHAIAEDKQGTRFAIDITLHGEPGSLTVAAAPAVTVALYDAVRQICDTRSG